MQFKTLTQRPQVFQWNPEAQIAVEPISLELQLDRGAEYLALDLRSMRSETALMPGAHCPPVMISKLKEHGNLWWLYGETMNEEEHDSMEPAEEAAWAAILQEMGLSHLRPIDLVRALDEFADCAIDFRYSDAFLQSMAQTLSMPLEYLEAWQAEGDGVIVDVGDDKIQGFC